jgi:hypothetical protein
VDPPTVFRCVEGSIDPSADFRWCCRVCRPCGAVHLPLLWRWQQVGESLASRAPLGVPDQARSPLSPRRPSPEKNLKRYGAVKICGRPRGVGYSRDGPALGRLTPDPPRGARLSGAGVTGDPSWARCPRVERVLRLVSDVGGAAVWYPFLRSGPSVTAISLFSSVDWSTHWASRYPALRW